ncbi:MAG: hypothetical protein R3C68_13305 [Myxococcota bacterium]
MGNDGTMYLVGVFSGTAPRDHAISSAGETDWFAGVLLPDGSVENIQQRGGAGYDAARGAAVTSDALWVAGIDDGPGTCTSQPNLSEAI